MDGDFYVYILQGKKKRYIGFSSNLDRRLEAHNKGISFFTKSGGPWELVWQSDAMSHGDALKLEKLIKKQKGGIGLQNLMNKHQKRGT